VSVAGVNDAATIAIANTELEFFENGGPQPVDPLLVVADVDDSHLEGADIRVTNGHIASEDRLAFTPGTSGIVGTFVQATGILTLSGHATVGSYETVLRTVTYNNASDQPFGGLLRIGLRVDDGDGLGPEDGRIVDVHPENDPPTVSDQAFALDQDTAGTITLGAADPDGDVLTYAVLSGPSHGTLGPGGNADQRLYTPTPGYHGPDSFTFRVTDAAGVQRTATVSITVNDTP
jgi:Bacterial Ig domain